MNTQRLLTLTGAVLLTLGLASCAQGPSVAEINRLTDQIVKASFRDESFVKVERITATDETNRLCSQDRKSTRLNSSHSQQSRMPSSA